MGFQSLDLFYTISKLNLYVRMVPISRNKYGSQDIAILPPKLMT